MNSNIRAYIREIIKESVESVQNGNILILVHPECFLEANPDLFCEYVGEIKANVPKFDKVFAYQALPQSYIDRMLDRSPKCVESFEDMVNVLNTSNADYVRDYDMLKSALRGEISEFLIENENFNVFISGGYQDLCLRDVCDNVFSLLAEEISEFGHSVKLFKPLMYHRRRHGDIPVKPDFGKSTYPSKRSTHQFDSDHVESDAWFEKLFERKKKKKRKKKNRYPYYFAHGYNYDSDNDGFGDGGE